MATDAIYLFHDENKLKRVERKDYATEDLLQELIANYPELLAGDQFNEEEPLRWLLIAREAAIPDESGSRWSLDHLLVDQNAIPTFVEVKRSSDTRIRREVVGQMLDYAANASKYWPKDEIKATALRRAGSSEKLDEEVSSLLGADSAIADSFWETVEINLRAGKVRLLFVADELPSELRNIIEFLNGKMQDIEVLGIELRQYTGEGLQAIVPKVIGKTERIRQNKSTPAGRKTNEAAFLESLEPDARTIFAAVLKMGREKGTQIYWGTKGFSLRITRGDRVMSLAYCYPAGVYGHTTPVFSLYTKIFTPEENDILRKELRVVAPFKESGRFTMDLPLSAKTFDAAMRVISILDNVINDYHEPLPA